jgi:hypothetical protein
MTTDHVELPDDLPDAVRQAIRAQDNVAFKAALEALPEAERAAITQRLEEGGIIGRAPDMAQMLGEFEPLLRGIAAVARGDEGPRAEINEVLPQMDGGGWQISAAVQRIWAGERNSEALTAGIDGNSALLVRRILELVDALAGASDEATGIDAETPRARERGTGGEGAIPESIQAALISGDLATLQVALAALTATERAHVEARIQEATQQAVARVQRRPEEIIAGLAAAVRAALEQQDDDALRAALAALPDDERGRALADLADLQALSLRAAQDEQRRDPRERFAPLLHAIARVAAGDDRPRDAVSAELAEFAEAGWQLHEPVARIWAGERDRDALVAGLDDQDTLLIERVLDLIAAPDKATGGEPEAPPIPPQWQRETGDAGLPASLDDLPDHVRAAVQQSDAQALQAALAALPPDETRAIFERLQQAGIISAGSLHDRPRPDIEQVIQSLLPLLSDIALAALGDEAARQIAEAVLPQMEAGGWRLSGAARRIWAGERDMAALTAGIDPNSSALVQQTLRLVADGPAMIVAAGALQIANLRRQADGATAQALRDATPQERAALADQLSNLAGQAEPQPGAPWQDVAMHLRALAAQLREP